MFGTPARIRLKILRKGRGADCQGGHFKPPTLKTEQRVKNAELYPFERESRVLPV